MLVRAAKVVRAPTRIMSVNFFGLIRIHLGMLKFKIICVVGVGSRPRVLDIAQPRNTDNQFPGRISKSNL